MSDCQVSLGRSDSKRAPRSREVASGAGGSRSRGAAGRDGWSREPAPPLVAQAPGARPGSGVETVFARRSGQATIWSPSTAEVRLAGALGSTLEWGQDHLSASSVESGVRVHPGLRAPRGRSHRPHRASLGEHGVDAVLGQIRGTALRTGLPELPTHRVPQTVEPQTIAPTTGCGAYGAGARRHRPAPVAHHIHGELPTTLAGFTGTQRLRACHLWLSRPRPLCRTR